MLILVLIILVTGVFINHASAQDFSSSSAIKLVYPRSGSTIESSSTFLVGQINTDSSLTCNNEKVRVNKAGFFAHVVSLHYGTNHFSLANAENNNLFNLNVLRKSPPPPIGLDKLELKDLKPNQDLGVSAGDIINFSVRATPDSNLTVQLGQHSLPLSIGQKNDQTNIDVAYGKTIKHYDANNSDLYKGSYRITTSDHFSAIHPQFKLINSLGSLSQNSKSTISTIESLSVSRTLKNPTIVRLGPGLARTTPLVDGVKVIIDGWSGDNLRCLYAPNHHVWINKNNIETESFSPAMPLPSFNLNALRQTIDTTAPQAVAQTINIVEDNYGERICLPLTERLPYQIEQKLNPNCLILKVYGVAPDTDWITSEPKTGTESKSNLHHVTWRQTEDDVYEITVHLNGQRQWGYKVYYEGTTLCLGIKSPLLINSTQSMSGIKVCIDPGHGGSEKGSIGCSGLPESQVNLDIASKTKDCLESLGAKVIMTRKSQEENPSLDERVRIATDNQTDFLISIHNNALPDGRDPWKEHGTSSYWYHPQSIELANCLKNSVKTTTNFFDLGARYQNLALVRGTAMPSVLLEIGFMINPDEFTQLIDPQFQSKIAQSIADGLKTYLIDRRTAETKIHDDLQ